MLHAKKRGVTDHLKELRHGLCILKKNGLNFSISLFVIRVNLRHP